MSLAKLKEAKTTTVLEVYADKGDTIEFRVGKEVLKGVYESVYRLGDVDSYSNNRRFIAVVIVGGVIKFIEVSRIRKLNEVRITELIMYHDVVKAHGGL